MPIPPPPPGFVPESSLRGEPLPPPPGFRPETPRGVPTFSMPFATEENPPAQGFLGDAADPASGFGRDAGDLSRSMLHGLLLGFDDDVISGINPEEGARYEAGIEAFRERDPTSAMIAELIGGGATAALPASWALRAPTVAGQAGRGAAVGSGIGLAQGAGESQEPWGMGRLREAIPSALLGAGGGVAGPALAQLGSKVAAPLARAITGRPTTAAVTAAATPTIRDLERMSGTLYDQLRQSGATIPADDFYQAGLRAMNRADADGLDSGSRVMNQFLQLDTGQPLTFSQLESVRRRASRTLSSTTADSEEVHAASIVLDELDGLIDRMGSLPREARDLWRRARVAETVEDVIYNARVSSANTGQALERTLRGHFATLLKSKSGTRGFLPEEVEAIEQFVFTPARDPMTRFLRVLGTFDPSRSMLSAAFSGAGIATSNPAMMATGVAGIFARNRLDAQAARQAENISQTVRTPPNQSLPPQPQLPAPLDDIMVQSALARFLGPASISGAPMLDQLVWPH